MTLPIRSIPVEGTVVTNSTGSVLVVTRHLGGYDTYKSGLLQLNEGPPVSVQVLTFDDITVLRILDEKFVSLSETWSGTLYVRQGGRKNSIPMDLEAAANDAQRDLDALDEAERRYAITFLGEAQSKKIRQGRIRAIIDVLPEIGSGE